MKKATISTVEITNVRGIDYLEFPVASLTLFTGGNAEGKSSALDAFRALFDGPFSHDPSLIRTGTDKATVLATLSNGTTMLRTMTLKRSTLDIRTVDGGKVRREAEFVKQLATGFAFDPLKFLSLKLKEQAQEFMKVMPIMFQPEELAGITTQVRPINLEALNGIRDGMYEDRAAQNVIAKNLDGSIIELQAAIPADSDENWAAKRDELAGELRDKRTAVADGRSKAQSAIDAGTDVLMEEVGKKIRDIQEQLAADIRVVEIETEKWLTEQTATLQSDIERLTAEHAEAREKAESATMAKALKDQLTKAIDKRGDAVEKSDNFTARMKRLDEVKLEKLKHLPIPGADFTDGELYIDGRPFRQLNGSDQMLVAIQIGKLAGGDLAFMVSDYFTEIDEDRIGELAELLPKAGMQLAAAFRIRGEALTVRPIRTPEDIAALKAAIRESVETIPV